MSDTPAFDFSKFVPGFDFLQNLGKGAAPAAPAMGGWVAPTLSVEELDKRITELKAVQFWLDQNAVALKATIQALEVQKMTLATLKGMNFNMADLANAFKLKPEAAKPAAPAAKAAEKPTEKAAKPAGAGTTDAPAAPAAPGVVDPLKWWGSLTEQFQQIAGAALKDANTQAALEKSKNLATNFAAEALKSVGEIAKAARKTVVPPAGPKADASKPAPAKKAPAKKAPAKKAAAKKHAG